MWEKQISCLLYINPCRKDTNMYVEGAYTLTSHTVALGGLVVVCLQLYPRFVDSNLAWKGH
jgi:hypothetical protein